MTASEPLEELELPEEARVERRDGFVVGVALPFGPETVEQLEKLLASRHAQSLTSLELMPESDPDDDEEIEDGGDALGPEPRALTPKQASTVADILALDLGGIRSLSFAYIPIAAEGARALAESRLGPLEVLDLRYGWIGDDGLAALAASPKLSSLTSLSLQRNNLRAKGARALAESPHLRGLRRLDLRYNALEAQGAQALAGSPVLAGLTRLQLYRGDVGKRGARALAESPHLPANLARFWRAV